MEFFLKLLLCNFLETMPIFLNVILSCVYCVSVWILGTFSTDGFKDGYGELDRAGLGIQGAVRTKARENKNSLATKTIPDYGVNEIVGETRTQN